MSPKKNIVFSEMKNGLLELDIILISDWEGFDKLIAFLEQYYAATTIEKFDGIGSRRCKLKIGNDLLELTHDDFYGNSLKSLSKQGNRVLKKIGEDLHQRLTTI